MLTQSRVPCCVMFYFTGYVVFICALFLVGVKSERSVFA